MLALWDIIFFVQYAYIALFLGLYSLEVYIILKQESSRSQFRTPFYKLFIIGAILDINFELLATIIHRIPMSPIMNGIFAHYKPTLAMTLVYGVAYYLPAAQEYLNIFIALNRLTAIVFNAHHNKIWHYLTPASILFTLTVPLISVWYLFLCPIVSIPVQEDNYTYYIMTADVANTFPGISPPLRTAILIIGGASICLILYTITALWMRYVPGLTKIDVDKRLFYFGATLFILNIPCAALQISLFQLGPTIENLFFAYKCLPFLVDIKSLLPPILLFVYNKSIRIKCYEFFGMKQRVKRVSERSFSKTVGSRVQV
ncbi:hypothetical protein PRIPAC_97540 [Pristionchus pacificus]|uniref:Serpentine receptor class gamma n=1 Tax=Pristionchus pacificus TaxID=54126 RepID=A0A2A6CGL9_PRIPA|nr:hypothetical protein PRIPAC_97540 [Pristionchus pacificus]|eukprot:PDM77364.1 G protein-coupled receptor [Pristionchus pacificus]